MHPRCVRMNKDPKLSVYELFSIVFNMIPECEFEINKKPSDNSRKESSCQKQSLT